MQSLSDHMSVYAAYHRHPMNKAIHFLFVPTIVWTLMVALDHVVLYEAATWTLTLGMAIVAALLLWYLLLDFTIGVVAVMVFSLLEYSTVVLNDAVSTTASLTIAGVVFVASWVFQFVGHGVWEKRRPALMDNLFQILVAPSFLMAEALFAMGLKQDLHSEVEQKMQAHLPVAPQR